MRYKVASEDTVQKEAGGVKSFDAPEGVAKRGLKFSPLLIAVVIAVILLLIWIF